MPAGLYVQVMPDAVCTLHAQGAAGTSKQELKLFADTRGIVLFYNLVQEKGMLFNLTLDCTADDGVGSSVSVPIEVRAVSDFEPAGAETDYLSLVPPAGRFVPALSGDPLSYSDKDLEAQGYPSPRPDPAQAPDEYQHWLEAVSKPFILAPQGNVRATLPGPKPATCSSNWDGFSLRQVGGAAAQSRTPYGLKCMANGTFLHSVRHLSRVFPSSFGNGLD